MPKYSVMVQVVKTLKEPLTIKADNEVAAKLRAEAIVGKWDGIDEVQAYLAKEIPDEENNKTGATK